MAERSLKADIFGVFSSNIFGLVVGLLIGIILPRELGPAGTGLFYAILAIPQLTFSLVELGSKASIVFFTGKKAVAEERMISALMFIFTISTVLCLIIFSIIFSLLNNPDYQLSFIILVILITPFRLITTYARAFILAKEKIKLFNRLNIYFLIINLLGVVGFVWIAQLGVFGAFLALLVASVLVAVYALILVLKDYKIRFHMEGALIGSIIKQGIVYALSFFMIKLNYRIDIVLLERLSNLKEVGFYSLGVHVAELLWQVPAALFVVILSRSANATDQLAMTRTVMKLLRVAFLFSFIGSIVLYFLAPPLVSIIYGEAFIPSIAIIRTIIPGILAFVVFQVLNSQLSGLGKPHISIIIFAPAVLINILLNLLWIPAYNGIGAAMATNVSYTLSAILLMIVYARVMHVSAREMLVFKKSDFDFIPTLYRKIIKRSS